MNHYDEMTCLLYLDGQLDRARARELSEHVDTCGECRQLLHALEGESRLLRAALSEEEESVPAHLLEYTPEGARREAVPLAWVSALGLAGAGAYSLWAWFVEPVTQQLNQAGFGSDSLLAMLFFGGVFWKGWDTMFDLTELLAAATLMTLAVVFLRRSWRRTSTLAVVLGALVCVLAMPPAVSAAEIRRANNVVVAADEVIKNDLIVYADTVKIEGTVEGDAILFGRNHTINGRVTGDVLAFGYLVRINGQVDGNVRTFSSFLSLNGTVAKNVSTFSQSFEFETKSQVLGSLTMMAAMATVDGRVTRDLIAMASENRVDGNIGGTALIAGDKITIGPSTEIQGKVKITSGRQPNISEKAKLHAGPPEIKIEKRRPDYGDPRYYWRQTLRWGAAFVLGLVIALLLPGFLRETVREGDRYALSLGVGVLALIVTPIAAALVCLTIVGLAVGITGLIFYLVALYSSQIFAGAFLGEKLLGRSKGVGGVLARLAVGLLVIRVLMMLPTWGGLAIQLAVVVFGLGAMTLTIFKRLQPEAPQPLPTAAPAAL